MGKRNTTGGSAHKSFARKLISSKNDLYLPHDSLECFALVTKLLGDGKCRASVHINNQIVDLLCHIRGKFRGRNKKNNLVSVNSLIVVGIRDWESIISNCDLIHLIDHSLISSIPPPFSSIVDSLISSSDLSSSTKRSNNLDAIDFTNDIIKHPSNVLSLAIIDPSFSDDVIVDVDDI